MSRLKTTEHGGGRPESPPCFSRQPAQQGQSELGGRRQEAPCPMPEKRPTRPGVRDLHLQFFNCNILRFRFLLLLR